LLPRFWVAKRLQIRLNNLVYDFNVTVLLYLRISFRILSGPLALPTLIFFNTLFTSEQVMGQSVISNIQYTFQYYLVLFQFDLEILN
jgi:hypothetical protein